MGSELIILPVMFLTFFGMVYYFLLTRNKERLALIEAGADAKLFKSAASNVNNWYFVIVLGLLAVGVSLGTSLGFAIESMGFSNSDAGYVIGIFLFSGLSLLASFFLIRKIKKEDEK